MTPARWFSPETSVNTLDTVNGIDDDRHMNTTQNPTAPVDVVGILTTPGIRRRPNRPADVWYYTYDANGVKVPVYR